MTPPAVAVVVPCHGLGRTVEEAVDSVLGQTRPVAEIVVVDDGSADLLTRNVLARLRRPRTRVVRQDHAGVAAARNHGVALTSAPYLVLLDADDVLHPDYVERLAGRLDEDDGVSFVSCAVQAFEGASYRWTPPAVDPVGTLTHGSVHVSSLFRRPLWDSVGGFDPALPAYEDLDFWLRALRAGFRGAVLDEPLLFYRVRRDSRYARGIEAAAYEQAMRLVLDRHRALLDEHGLDVLRAKESFLVDVDAHHRALESQRRALEEELRWLDAEIRAAAARLAPRPGSQARPSMPAPAWGESVPRALAQRFLDTRRWLLRGRVAIVAEPWMELDVPRGAAEDPEPEWHGPDWRPEALYDAVVVLAVSPAIPLDETIERARRALRPGGTLVAIVGAAGGARVLEARHRPHWAETALRAALARELPLDTFDVEPIGNAVTATATLLGHAAPVLDPPAFEGVDPAHPVLFVACARVPGGERLPVVRRARAGSPLPPARGGLVLAYHRVAALVPDTHGLCVPAERFREQMRFLRERCTPMDLEELVLTARSGTLPPRAVAVTFDDGYLDALETAATILEEEGVPATFFVNTDRLDEPHEAWHDRVERVLLGPDPLPATLELSVRGDTMRADVSAPAARRRALFDRHGRLLAATVAEREEAISRLFAWAGLEDRARPERRLLLSGEVRSLARRTGCRIGSHSASHLLLTGHPPDVQREELSRSRRTLEQLLGRFVSSFAYPFGDHDDSVEAAAAAAPHAFAFTVEAGLVDASSDPLRLPRLEVTPEVSGRFAGTVLTFLDRGTDPVATAGGMAGGARDAWAENIASSRDEIAGGRTALESRPQFLIVDPTSRCNARCVMCPVSFRPPGDHGTDMSTAVFDKLVPLLPFAAHVNLFASGEPTIARNIGVLLAEALRRRDPRAPLWISTNGKRVGREVFEILAGAENVWLQFSVDGGTPEVFEAIRRGISFDELRRSLDEARRVRAGRAWPKLAFSSTISKRNVHDVAAIFELARDAGIDHVSFYEEDPEDPSEEAFVLDEADRPVFEAQQRRIDAAGVPYTNGLVFRGRGGLRAVEPPPPDDPPPLTCTAPWRVLHVRADGSVRTCCTLRRSMGDLGRQSLDEVWNGEAYVALRRAFVEQRGIPGTCYRCTDPLRTWQP